MFKFIKRIIWKVKQHFVKKKVVPPEQVEDKTKNIASPYSMAVGELGVKEIRGRKHNERVVEYHQSCTLKATDDETPWCSAFVNWCHKQVHRPRTSSAMAISWLDWGEEVEEPRTGDVVVFRRTSSKWKGHVGFYVRENKKSILVLGGNQSNEVNYQWYPKQGATIYLAGYRRAK